MSSPLQGLPNEPMEVEGRFTIEWKGWLATVQRILFAQSSSGTTAQRPTAALYIGQRYYDTTLGKPIWVQSLGPTVWADATGAPA